ncbi:MAG: hypothetical protein PF484_10470 [Bacteroidales bacterium]|jgi:hypothetical protein|nr:hypothetical protein [Bacteroidales bacterium]
MDNLLKNIFKGISIILIAIATIYQIVIFYQGGSPSDTVLDGYFLVAYIAFGISALCAILFPIIQVIANPKDAVRSLIVVAFLVALWFVAYALSDNSFTPAQLENMETNEQTSRLVGAGLFYTYFIFIMAIGATIYASISSIFK